MAAGLLDYFKKVGASTVTTLSAPGKALAANSITVGSTTNYPTDTGIVIAIRQVDANGNLIPGTYTEWNAIVTSATTLTIGTVPVLGTDRVYPAASTTQVYIPLSSPAYNGMVAGLLIGHNQDGTHKAFTESNIVPTAAIQNDAVTSTKIAQNAVQGDDLATSAILLGYAQVTISQSGIISTTGTQVTGLSASVTVPAGGRKVKITAWISNSANTGNNTNFLQIWDGTVGSGTKLAEAIAKNRIATDATGFMTAIAVASPAAGAKTYNVGFAVDANSATVIASGTSPAFILVELI